MTGLVPRLPTLAVSGFMMMSSVLSFSCGLVLDTQVKNSRKSLEIQMNIINLLFKDEK